VRKLLLSAAVIGLISSQGSAVHAQANAAGANAARYGIAVVDISYIFKNSASFNAQIESLKTEMKAADDGLKADRDALVQLQEKRNTLKPGSPEFKALDEQIAHQQAEFSIKQGTVRRDFLEKEAAVYFKTYTEVSNAVRYFAQQNNIGMVLRFNGDQVDPAQREDVMRAIMQPIVHQNNIDITPDVLAMLSRGAGGATAPAPGTPTAGRPSATRPQ
jgi:Skp family chaperone for outer membrane proteins